MFVLGAPCPLRRLPSNSSPLAVVPSLIWFVLVPKSWHKLQQQQPMDVYGDRGFSALLLLLRSGVVASLHR